MYFSAVMVIGQEKSDYCNTDVSCILSAIFVVIDIHIRLGGSDGNLSRVLFAKIIEGSLVYEEGKDDYFVYGGIV